MDTATLTVLFEAPFWIGLYERQGSSGYQVCKITFGAEPRDFEVYELLLHRWHTLRFTAARPDGAGSEERVNPKRMQRLIHRQTEPGRVGTRAQQALSAQREQDKTERRASRRQARQERQAQAYEARQQKRKEKHRGH